MASSELSSLGAVPLSELVSVSQQFRRSIHLQSDWTRVIPRSEYLLTDLGLQSLERIVQGLTTAGGTRAWTITGPYGSGKSAFALFLSHVLQVDHPDHGLAVEKVRCDGSPSAKQVMTLLDSVLPKGFLVVPLSGSRAPLWQTILSGMYSVLVREDLDTSQVAAAVESQLDCGDRVPSPEGLAGMIEHMSITAGQRGFSGLVIIHDELGKNLEYIALHPEDNDAYFLQVLAEHAARSGDTPFAFIGILHQAFERYTTNLGETAKQEWAKIQGRFEDIVYQDPPDQMLQLLAKAIEYKSEAMVATMKPSVDTAVRRAADLSIQPVRLDDTEFTRLAASAYPLHPTVFVALPYVFRRLAQNRRSLFAFLSAGEPRSLQTFISEQQVDLNNPAYMRLPELFDYLVANFGASLYTNQVARPLVEAQDIIERSTDLDELQVRIIKTIALLMMLEQSSHLRPDKKTIQFSLDDCHSTDVAAALDAIEDKSIVTYRRFRESYALWQGSDVNIEDQLDKAKGILPTVFDIKSVIHKYGSSSPAIAQRHSYVTGVLRFFEVHYLDARSRDELPAKSSEASGQIFFCLPFTPQEREAFHRWVIGGQVASRDDVVAAIPRDATHMSNLLLELRALDWVESHTPQLRDDKIARQEVLVRKHDLAKELTDETSRLFDVTATRGGGCTWYNRGREIDATGRRGVAPALSDICDRLYEKGPRIWNELINRRSLSSSAVAAQRKLIRAMINSATEPRLGIEGYPPEISMYESVLRNTGIHRELSDGVWGFHEPYEGDAGANVSPVWQALDEQVFRDFPEKRPILDILDVLSRPPYGLTDGIYPVLLCAYLMVKRHHTTLYRENTFLPEPTEADWEVLTRQPQLFSVAGYSVDGERQVVVERIARKLATEPTVLSVIRKLFSMYYSLPEHVWRTNDLPERARSVRDTVERSNSPEKLLFVELPTALGLDPFESSDVNEERVELFFDRLNEANTVLHTLLEQRINRARDQVLAACGFPTGDSGWEAFCEHASVMRDATLDPDLAPVLRRASMDAVPRENLTRVLTFLAEGPPGRWTDHDVRKLPDKARRLGQLFRREREAIARETAAAMEPGEEKVVDEVVEELQQHFEVAFEEKSVSKEALRLALTRWLISLSPGGTRSEPS